MSTYRVTPHDHLLRFRVASASRLEVEHVVDLGAFAGNGQCSCEHFDFRMRPAIEDGTAKVKGAATRCAHITAAREAFANDMIQRLSRIERKPTDGQEQR